MTQSHNDLNLNLGKMKGFEGCHRSSNSPFRENAFPMKGKMMGFFSPAVKLLIHARLGVQLSAGDMLAHKKRII